METIKHNCELIIDCFAGGGGTSLGLEMAGLNVDIAINHDEDAIEMHKINHPATKHFCENIWQVNPIEATGGRPVALAWFSPDCTHFSKAKGGKPVKKQIRGLAWVIVKWARLIHPRVIILENVEEFKTWGPLTRDNKPNPKLSGRTFNLWVNQLRGLGYEVQWRQLVAADYGVPTMRKRLFVIARCDGEPIVWPEATHAAAENLFGLKPYRTAAECIDWSIPCPSIFERKKPLAENTLRRIARGIYKFVINAKEPFIVTCNHSGGNRIRSIDEPLMTLTAAHDAHGIVTPIITRIGNTKCNSCQSIPPSEPLRTIVSKAEDCLIVPHLTKYHGAKGEEVRGQATDEPVRTLDTSNRFGLVTAFLSKYFNCDNPCSGLKKPMPTVTAIDHNAVVTAHLLANTSGNASTGCDKPLKTVTTGNHHYVVTSYLTKFYNTNIGSDMKEPVPTITGQGQHIGEVQAFLVKYYGTAVGQSIKKPLHTITSKDKLGLVTIQGEEYQIADIGLRMLAPRELARAQGFPDSYILTGSKKNQVAKIGNSVCPQLACALAQANVKVREISNIKTA